MSFIDKALTDSCDPEKFESYITSIHNQTKCLESEPENIDCTMVYNLFLGDISVAPSTSMTLWRPLQSGVLKAPTHLLIYSDICIQKSN